VLKIDGTSAGQAPVELRYAPAVPALSEIGVSPLGVATAGGLDENLELAHEVLDFTTGRPTAFDGAAAVDHLSAAAAALEAIPAAGREDVTGARLAILLGLLALQAQSAGEASAAAALGMLSNDVWNTARTLVPSPAVAPLGRPATARSAVFVGGAFNGRPPALRPGDDIGAGLPGGLPPIDPTQILRG
jgi:hypothetical protein